MSVWHIAGAVGMAYAIPRCCSRACDYFERYRWDLRDGSGLISVAYRCVTLLFIARRRYEELSASGVLPTRSLTFFHASVYDSLWIGTLLLLLFPNNLFIVFCKCSKVGAVLVLSIVAEVARRFFLKDWLPSTFFSTFPFETFTDAELLFDLLRLAISFGVLISLGISLAAVFAPIFNILSSEDYAISLFCSSSMIIMAFKAAFPIFMTIVIFMDLVGTSFVLFFRTDNLFRFDESCDIKSFYSLKEYSNLDAATSAGFSNDCKCAICFSEISDMKFPIFQHIIPATDSSCSHPCPNIFCKPCIIRLIETKMNSSLNKSVNCPVCTREIVRL